MGDFLTAEFWGFRYTQGISPWCDHNSFFQSVACCFILLISVSHHGNGFNFDNIQFTNFVVYGLCFCCHIQVQWLMATPNFACQWGGHVTKFWSTECEWRDTFQKHSLNVCGHTWSAPSSRLSWSTILDLKVGDHGAGMGQWETERHQMLESFEEWSPHTGPGLLTSHFQGKKQQCSFLSRLLLFQIFCCHWPNLDWPGTARQRGMSHNWLT